MACIIEGGGTMNVARNVVLTVVLGVVLAGCAASRSELVVPVQKSAVTPTKGAVKIVEVVDRRIFEIDPGNPSTPSVRDNEIHNKALTAKAVGRKRGGWGNAWGDVVLPEGQTVSGLVETILEAALTEKGYAVVSKGAAGYDSALPLSADVLKFWSWVNFGMDIKITHRSEIALKGPWPVSEGNRLIHGDAFYNSYIAITEEDWVELLKNGAASLKGNVAKALQ
jgi:hypothetical protein